MQKDGSDHNTGDRVVQLLSRPRSSDQPALASFVSYWRSKCLNGRIPRRSEIDPRGIEPLLSNAFIIERIAPGLARLRIAGSHLNDLLGMEVRGMPLSALFTAPHRDALSHKLVRLFDEPACLRLGLCAPGPFLTPDLTGTMLLLPLRSDLGDTSRALGCLVTNGPPGRAPRRFQITDSSVEPVVTQRRAVSAAPQNADPGSTPPVRARAKAKQPNLRLIVAN